jgi:hypothetical protein
MDRHRSPDHVLLKLARRRPDLDDEARRSQRAVAPEKRRQGALGRVRLDHPCRELLRAREVQSEVPLECSETAAAGGTPAVLFGRALPRGGSEPVSRQLTLGLGVARAGGNDAPRDVGGPADLGRRPKLRRGRYVATTSGGALRSPISRGAQRRAPAAAQILERSTRAAGRYAIHVEDDSSKPSGLRLRWSAKPEWDEWSKHSEGTYLLRTNVHEWSEEELWKTYVQLTEAESAFRIHKSDLSLRPIWHQKAERVQAHILVCFLAYVLWKTLEQWQQRAQLGNSPRTILEELARIQSTDVVLPLADGSDRELRIRCVVRPDRAQAVLLDRLGLRLPERLRVPPLVARM